MAALSDVEYRVVTNLAIIVIFSQVKGMAENDRICIFELELDILGFSGR